MDTGSLTNKPNIYNGKKKISSTNGAGLTDYLYVEKMKIDPYFHLAQSSSPSGSRTSTKTRYTESNRREIKSLEFISTGGIFLNRMPMTYPLRSRTDKLDLMKLKSFCKAKDIVNKTNRQPTDWKKNTLH